MDIEWKDRGESGGGVRGAARRAAGVGLRGTLKAEPGLVGVAGKSTVEVGGR